MAWLIVAAWIAQGQNPIPVPGVPGWVWAALSALGGIAGTVLSGKVVVPTFAYNRERDRADKLEAEVRDLNGIIRNEFAPSLARNTELVQRQSEALERERNRRRT